MDREGLERLVDRLVGGGVAGLFLLGTTGEGPSLSFRLRREVIETVAQHLQQRVPLLVGITDTAAREALAVAELAADAGADGVVVAPPPYFPIGQDDLREYVEELAEDAPLPLILYNMPSHCKVAFALETVRRLIEIPRIVGLKDSSGDMIYFHALRQMTAGREDFSLLVGPEELLAESVLLGGDGGVCGGANLEPWLYVELDRAARAQEMPRVQRLHARVLRLAQTVYSGQPGSPGVIKGLKAALEHLGVCRGALAPPLHPLAEETRSRILAGVVAQALGEAPAQEHPAERLLK